LLRLFRPFFGWSPGGTDVITAYFPVDESVRVERLYPEAWQWRRASGPTAKIDMAGAGSRNPGIGDV
jgi:hypothetical protein